MHKTSTGFPQLIASGHLLFTWRQQLDFGPQRWVSLLERLQVNRFVVAGTGLPAVKQNANPFEGQDTKSGMMAFATAPQPLIQGLSPTAPVAGVSGKLVEGLAQKLRASPAPVHPPLLAALLGDRRNAKQLLRLLGGLKTIPIRAKGRHQARGQNRTRSRKTVKQGAI